mgnify:FL=1
MRKVGSISQAAEFTRFLKTELIPFMDQTFRTTQERMLFGWEATGGFVIRTFTYHPTLFDAYFASSPTPVYSRYFPMYKKQFQDLAQLLETPASLQNKYLYIGGAENDYPSHYGMNNLTKLLRQKSPEGFRWRYRKLLDTSHEMTAYQTIFQGLKLFYYNYRPLDINSIAEFQQLGGTPYIQSYYDKRAKRFGFDDPKELAKAWHATLRNITLTAVGEDNYLVFDQLYQQFKSKKLLERSFMPHGIAYARFYLRHNQPQKAQEINQFLLKKFAKRAAPYHMAGKIYEKLNQPQKARKYYTQALQIARNSQDFRLTEYQESFDHFLKNQGKK